MAAAWQNPPEPTPKVPQLHGFFQRIDVVGAREGARADLAGIFRHGLADRGAEIGVALDEFRHPRGEPEHVLEHQDLAIAGDASADADGRDFDGSRDAASERLAQARVAAEGWQEQRELVSEARDELEQKADELSAKLNRKE